MHVGSRKATVGVMQRVGGYPALVMSILCLSTGSVVVRKVGASGLTIAALRSVFATVLWQILLAARGRHVTWSGMRRIGPAGALFGVNIALFFAGVTRTSIANAEFIGALTPLLVVPAAAVVFHERLRWSMAPAALGALCGVAVVLFAAPPRGTSSWEGNVLVAAAIVLWAAYLLLTKHLRRGEGVDVVEFMATTSFVAALTLVPIALVDGSLFEVPRSGIPWLVVLTLVNGLVAHGLLATAQRRVPVGTISMMQIAQPALAVAWAALLLGEALRPLQVVGMVVVICSIAAFTSISMRATGADAAAPPLSAADEGLGG